MGKLGWQLTSGIIALAVMSISSTAIADSMAFPFSYKQITPGGKYVFVMIAPCSLEEDVASWNEEAAAGIREIRRSYSQSGLYRNDGSTEPLWTVDWYAYDVVVSSDGIHLIRQRGWSRLDPERNSPLRSSLDGEAVSFFANGQLLRSYRIGELVDYPDWLPRTVSHFQWTSERTLDDARLQYALRTRDGNRFVFDIRTGSIIAEYHSIRLLGRLALVIAALTVVAWFARRWRSRRRIATAEPGHTASQQSE